MTKCGSGWCGVGRVRGLARLNWLSKAWDMGPLCAVGPSLKSAFGPKRSCVNALFRPICKGDAFEWLKKGEPQRLPKGTIPSEANVGREAGVSPSAMTKARFPDLVASIHRWNEQHAVTSSESRISEIEGRQNSGSLLEQINSLTVQRDDAISILNSTDDRILELTLERERLRGGEMPNQVASIRCKREGAVGGPLLEEGR